MEIIRSNIINPQQPLTSAADILRQSLDQNNFDGSLMDCHVPGMDSIVLCDNRIVNGGMARIFVTRNGQHGLGDIINEITGDFVLGVHNHRFPLTIVPLLGRFINYEVALNPQGADTLHEYDFSSGITGTISATHRRAVRAGPPTLNEQSPGGLVRMQAADLHTVVIPDQDTRRGMSAWLVLEEPEERATQIYSPTDHLRLSSEKLYNPFDPAEARETVQKIIAEIS